jgi:hypothetical protein
VQAVQEFSKYPDGLYSMIQRDKVKAEKSLKINVGMNAFWMNY